MKEGMNKMRKCGVFMAFLLVLSMMYGMLFDVQAEDSAVEAYDPEARGSITIALADLEGMDKEGVQINLYKVGDLDTSGGYLNFSLVSGLEDTDVDLNDIATAEANETLAETLSEAVAAKKMEAVKSIWSDADGKAVFEDLDQGMYLITEENANAYGTFSSFVLPVPYATETAWDYDVAITPKANAVTTLGRIDVTKKIKGLDAGSLQDIHTESATYYIGLFLDENGEHPYGGAGNNVKPVHIIDGNSGTVSFDNVPITDKPYYIFETTSDGTPIEYLQQQGTENGFYCMAGEELLGEGYDRAPEISLEDEGDAVGNAVISNVYSDLPDGFYYTGEITITKSVMDNGQMIASEDTFYAGIFTVDSQGNVNGNPSEVVKLKNNGSITVEVPLGGMDGTEPVTYSVKETDEKGVPVDKDAFPYTVTGEGTVDLSVEQTSGTIHLTNTLKDNEGYYQEGTTAENPETADPGDGSNNENNGNNGNNSSGGNNRSSRSTKTGDDNPIVLYLGVFAAAVIIGGAVAVRRRRNARD